MENKRKIGIWYIVGVVLLVAYLIFTAVVEYLRQQEVYVKELRVEVEDSLLVGFIKSSYVHGLVDDSLKVVGKRLQNVDLEAVESLLERNSYLSSAVVSSTMHGEIDVKVTQRHPQFRVTTQRGYDFYVDSTMSILKPVTTYYPDVLNLTGNIDFGFSTNFFGQLDEKKDKIDIDNLKKLSNFVENINKEDYFRDLISQIYLRSGDKGGIRAEIVPSVGRALILFGDVVDSKTRLSKLLTLYQTAYSYAGLDTVQLVDVRFSNQVLIQ